MLLFTLSLLACGEKETDTLVDDTAVGTDTEDSNTEDSDDTDSDDTDSDDTDSDDTEDTEDTEDTDSADGFQDLGAGDLVITEIMKNPCGLDDDPNTTPEVECIDPQIADEAGEWFEVLNTTSEAINLNGMRVHETGAGEQAFVVSTDLTIAANGYLVFGVSGDTSLNGGVAVDYVYSVEAFGFRNGADSIALSNNAGIIDSVEYDDGDTFHDFKGYSLSLNPSSLDATANDDGTNWCKSSTELDSGDYGTPGAANDSCQ